MRYNNNANFNILSAVRAAICCENPLHRKTITVESEKLQTCECQQYPIQLHFDRLSWFKCILTCYRQLFICFASNWMHHQWWTLILVFATSNWTWLPRLGSPIKFWRVLFDVGIELKRIFHAFRAQQSIYRWRSCCKRIQFQRNAKGTRPLIYNIGHWNAVQWSCYTMNAR